MKATVTVCNFRTWDCCYYYRIFQDGPIRASVIMILQKGFRQTLRRIRKGLGTIREDRGKGNLKWLDILKLFFQNCFRVSLVYLALAWKYVLQVSKSSRLSVPHFRAQRGTCFWTLSDFYQKEERSLRKLIAFQKRDGHTYNDIIHTMLAANPWPTIRDPMPRANVLAISILQILTMFT